jgi:hypothetical protein
VTVTATDGAGNVASASDAVAIASAPVVVPPVVVPPVVVPPAVKPTPIAIAKLAVVPGTRRCLSRRLVRIRVRKRAGDAVVSVAVFIGSKRKALRSGSAAVQTVSLRGLPKGRYTLKLLVTLKSGKQLVATRRYRTCATRKR